MIVMPGEEKKEVGHCYHYLVWKLMRKVDSGRSALWKAGAIFRGMSASADPQGSAFGFEIASSIAWLVFFFLVLLLLK